MRKLLVVLLQEYSMKVRTKAFIIGTILFPVFIGGVMVLPALFMTVGLDRTLQIAVVDETGRMMEPLSASLTDTTKTGHSVYTLVRELSRGRSREQIEGDLRSDVAGKRIDGFIVIPDNVLEGGAASYYAENVSDFQRNEAIHRAITQAVRTLRIGDSALDPDQVNRILGPVRLETFRVGVGGEARQDQGTTFALAYVLGFIFYISLLIYGTMMLRAALEEKTSRSAEVMVSMVRSTTLMGGKILGIGLVGLTQLAAWAVIVGLVLSYMAASGMGLFGQQDILAQITPEPMLVVFFFVYFILGFIVYAGLFGAIGAMVNSETEAQQLQTPVTLPIIIAFMMMFLAIRDPNGTVVRVVSQIPLFSPILMIVRIAVQPPPAWEIALSLAILLAFIAWLIWAAGKVFRVGLLMYGKRPTLPELVKWIRYG